MIDRSRNLNNNTGTTDNSYSISHKADRNKPDSARKKTESTSIMRSGEKSLVKKNEYESIHKVFGLKDLNIKFRSIVKVMGDKSKLKFAKSKNWFLKSRFHNLNFKSVIITILVVINMLLLLTNFGMRYKVYMNNQYVGVVADKQQFAGIMDEACKQISSEISTDVCFDSQPVYKSVLVWKSQKVNSEEVINNLKTKGLYKKKGYAICVNGMELIVVHDRTMAEGLLEKLKEPFKETSGTKVEFVENIEVKEKAMDQLDKISFDEALAVLSRTKQDSKIYKVQKGDTLWIIARKNGMTIDQIMDLNPGLTEFIREGQEIKLNSPVPLINIRTKNVTTLEEEVPYNVIEEKDSNSYRNQRKVVSRGKNGLKEVSIEIVKENGIEVGRNVITEKVLKESVPQKEIVGTKALPPRWGTGSFKRPVYGLLTSRFGMRWGTMHEGIDIEGDIGDPIYAADGGKVIFAGYEGGYGKLIKINHDNEYTTYYGHCSKILVEEGARVAKGQKIGLIGMTGRTTGPHLHFEIRKNGVPQNPVKYLK